MDRTRRRLAQRFASLTASLVFIGFLTALTIVAGTRTPTQPQRQFTLFESGQVRPLAQSPDGQLLFAVNTPDNRLEVYATRNHRPRHSGDVIHLQQSQLTHIASIPVGVEPVAVAARNNREVWVVNHLSDSVSVVDVRDGVMRVVRTLVVGDEPRDIVFAGENRERAFITTAHRGQNAPFDPQLTTPGIGRADVWVFDADAVSRTQRQTIGGTPLTIVNLFTDTPRALAVSPDGILVYAAGS
jgi:YVTN family beta-propeller protein